jgi:2-polyprenyl-6-methoxyphenol hydroxylase-like FAD-dependent oxidoreductase
VTTASEASDVTIVGAGLAGAAAAAVLARAGHRIALVDPDPVCPPAFKAEKLEPDQAELLERLGLLQGILPHTAPIHAIRLGYRGHALATQAIEQHGILYQDLVNAVRRQVPTSVATRKARAVELVTGAELQTVILDSGERITSRLLVVACGTGGRLHRALGIEKRILREAHSLCSGFDIASEDGKPFPFAAVTYYAERLATRIDYATLFAAPGRMRLNLFSYREPRDPWVRALSDAPHAELERALPGLTRVIGSWCVTSRVEHRVIDLYVAEKPARDGVVLIGDAFQSVCPATGTGLSKVLTDVWRLCEAHVPAWLTTPGMGVDKIAAYYGDPAKTSMDRGSLEAAEYRRRFGTDDSLRWRVHRARCFGSMALAGLRVRMRHALAAGTPPTRQGPRIDRTL